MQPTSPNVQPEQKRIPRVAAIITTIVSDAAQLQAAVESVRSAGIYAGVELELICVLNDHRRAIPDLAGCRVVTTDFNLGYAGGLVWARGMTSADYLWIIQDDMVVPEHALSSMIAVLKSRPDAGLISPLVSAGSGKTFAQLRAGLISPEGDMQTPYPIEIRLSKERPRIPSLNWAALAGALIPSKVWDEVGGPDVSFFPLQYVDVDFCFRITAAGYAIVIEPEVQIAHELAGSSAGLLKRYLNVKSRERFREKHGSGRPSMVHLSQAVEKLDPPTELVEQVAKVASLDFVDLARFANKEINLLLAELAELSGGELPEDVEAKLAVATQQIRIQSELEAMKKSLSWRITAPLRKIGGLLTKKKPG